MLLPGGEWGGEAKAERAARNSLSKRRREVGASGRSWLRGLAGAARTGQGLWEGSGLS